MSNQAPVDKPIYSLLPTDVEFTVRLPSNRFAAFRWRPVSTLDERIVKIEGSEYLPFDGGIGGEEVWTFLVGSRGDTEITMEYVPRYEGTPTPVKTATIRVSVRPASVR